MNLSALLSLLVIFSLTTNPALAQAPISDLQTEIDSGRISVVSLLGNGNSSGMAIEGAIRNSTERSIRIATNLSRPIYLSNRSSSKSQNMIAFGLYGRDGGYYDDGTTSYIDVPANQSLDVSFIAYCADYEKENPSSSDSFSISEVPANLARAASQIAEYKRNNPDEDIVVAAQIALWFAQGLSSKEIQTTFPFSAADEAKAIVIISQ